MVGRLIKQLSHFARKCSSLPSNLHLSDFTVVPLVGIFYLIVAPTKHTHTFIHCNCPDWCLIVALLSSSENYLHQSYPPAEKYHTFYEMPLHWFADNFDALTSVWCRFWLVMKVWWVACLTGFALVWCQFWCLALVWCRFWLMMKVWWVACLTGYDLHAVVMLSDLQVSSRSSAKLFCINME